MSRESILQEVSAERDRQEAKWGPQDWPICSTLRQWAGALEAQYAKARCNEAAKNNRLTFADILDEEVAEVYAESDPLRQREELVQVAAVAVQMIEVIDRRLGK